ncbi:PAS domain S-box-containing protein [Trichlorobacter thiogenes]|uniref:histidine kinase n=1 Tax=Trichlorobacter thiogenes TaxID=115783 RepID=A0A1T4R012_9BACT|nr:PAS domain S-box protein [Trichlorobacter thiogenes]SKA09359.1 PAS domain S-box-containing protein [Trichlorobacter thiogenes]
MQQPAMTQRSPSGFLNRMAMGLVLLLVMVSLPAIYSLSHSRNKAEQDAKTEAKAIALTLGQSVISVFINVDNALQMVAEEVVRHTQRGGKEQELQTFIKRQFGHVPELDSLVISDAQGWVVWGTQDKPARSVSVADRDYFNYLRDHPDAGMVLSKPIISKINSRWIIACARRINLPNNRFGGVAIGLLPMQQFQELFSQVVLGNQGSVSLRFNDLSLIVYHSPVQQKRRSYVSGSKEVSFDWQQKLAKGETNSGEYHGISAVDGVKRSYSYRLLQPYRLYLNVGMAVDDYLAAWRKELLLTSFALLFCWAGVLLLIRQMYHHKHQTELEQLVQERTKILTDTSHELAQNEERLQALLDISEYQTSDIQGLLEYALEKIITITRSKIGYIYHYHEDSQEFVLNTWSKEVMPACTVANPSTIYKLDKTGIWGEAVRQRKAILINDFDAPDDLKKGYPDGHVHLSRFLTVPVFDLHQSIVAVVGVANKEQPYTEQDSQQLSLLMAEVWRISQRIELEKKLVNAGHEWQSTFDAISDSVSLIDREMRILRCNLACKRFFNREFTDIIGRYCWEVIHNSDGPIEDCPMQRSLKTRKTESQLVFQGKSWLHLTVDPLLDEQHEVTGAVLIIHDDTERVLADQSQRELLSMLEAVHNELYVFNPDTLLFEYANQSALQNLGYSLAQLQTMTPLDIKPMMNRHEFIPMISALMTGDLPLQRFETFHQRANGTSYPVDVNLQMVSTHSGRRCLAVIHDNTEQHQQREALRASQSLVESIMNSMKSTIAVLDEDGMIIRVNLEWSSFATQNGGSAELIAGVGLNYLEVCQRAAVNNKEVEELLTGLISVQRRLLPVYSAEYSCHSPNEQRWFIVYAVPLENSKGGIVLTHLNITSRKFAEIALGIERDRLEMASVAGNIALWDWDIKTGSLIWSDAVDRMMGAEPGTLPRTITAWEDIIHPEDLERVNQTLSSHLEHHTPYVIDYRVRNSDGSYMDWHDSGQAYFDDSGVAIRMSGACIDITDRTKNELQIRELHAQLLQQEKMASIGQLSAGIAHEINNPMGFINSNLGTLEKYVDKFDRYIATLEPLVQSCCTEQQQQSAQVLRKELKLDYVLRDIRQLLEESSDGAGRVMRIVQDLKTFSRSDTAQIARADLHQCIDSTINIIWNQIKYVAELKKEYGDLPKVPCNIQQVNQVFMNLLVNACHAIESNQLEALGTITVRTWADEDNAFVAISDTGCGMSEEVQRRIFEPFYTTKEVGKGTGLGLSISHEIIKKHAGELTVTSVVGTGTTFTIRLPLNQPVSDGSPL